MRRIKRHLSYANVAATLALMIAVAGGTTAIAGGKAPKNSVASSSIKPFNVTAGDLAGIRVVKSQRAVQCVSPHAPRKSASLAVAASGPASGPVGASSPGNNGWYVEQAERTETRPVTANALCLRAKPGK